MTISHYIPNILIAVAVGGLLTIAGASGFIVGFCAVGAACIWSRCS